jgi:hypothetical protein
VPRQTIKIFPTRREAEQWANGFAYARRFNRLPALVVEPTPDGQWAVVNPDADAKARRPLSPLPVNCRRTT